MDLSLTRMDGLEATKQIREIDRMRTVPIVAVTAHQETDFREGQGLGLWCLRHQAD